jgi:hypothetical protein
MPFGKHAAMPATKAVKFAAADADASGSLTLAEFTTTFSGGTRDEKHSITNLHPEHPVFSSFAVKSPSGMTYQVEIRDLKERSFSCNCPDFRTAGLVMCKHVEATLIWLKRRLKGEVRLAEKSGSSRIDLVPDGYTLRIERNLPSLPQSQRPLFDLAGRLRAAPPPRQGKARPRRHPGLTQDRMGGADQEVHHPRPPARLRSPLRPAEILHRFIFSEWEGMLKKVRAWPDKNGIGYAW